MADNLKTEGYYVGKEAVKTGQKKDKAGNLIFQETLTGEKKLVIWTLWKVKFKHQLDSQFAVGFSTFDEDVEKKYSLVPLEHYIVEYYEQPNKTYPDKPHKAFVMAVKGSLPANHEERVANIAQTKDSLYKEFDAFIPSYMEVVQKEVDFTKTAEKSQVVQSPVHMLGMYLLNTHPDTFWEGYVRACKALGVEIPRR